MTEKTGIPVAKKAKKEAPKKPLHGHQKEHK